MSNAENDAPRHPDEMTPEQRLEHFTLPEQRIRINVRNGGRGTWHLVEYRTDPAWNHPGRWTRRAASRRAFCGSLSALLVGTDAAEWPTERVAPSDLDRVTCARCGARAARVFGLLNHVEPRRASE